MRRRATRAQTHGIRRRRLFTEAVVIWDALVYLSAAVRTGDGLMVLSLVAATALAVAGYLLGREPEQAKPAKLLLLAAFVLPVSDLGSAFGVLDGQPSPVGQPLGSGASQLEYASWYWAAVPLAAVALLYPAQHFERRWYRWFVAAAALMFVVVPSLESLAFTSDEVALSDVPYWVSLVPGGEAMRNLLWHVGWWGGGLVAVVGMIVLGHCWAVARGVARKAIRSADSRTGSDRCEG